MRWGRARDWAVGVPPLMLVAVLLMLRDAGGPFWLWSNLDPDYFYLLDALNVASGRSPGHVYHPGFTLHLLGGLILRLRHPLADSDALIAAVLADPERYLGLLSGFAIAVIGMASLLLGLAARYATGSVLQALTVQIAPFLSSLTLKNEFHFRPESLLVAIVLLMCALAVLALKPDRLVRSRMQFAAGFGTVAALGVATKITAAPIFLMPLLLLASPRRGAASAFGVAAAVGLIVVALIALPVASTVPLFVAWIGQVAGAAGPHGQGASGLIDLAHYPNEVLRMLKRPPLSAVLILSVSMLAFAAWRARRGRPLPALELRLLGGAVLAQVLQAIVVAKQPGGQYMIPAYVLCGFSLLILVRIVLALSEEARAPVRRLLPVAAFGLVGLLAVGQATVVAKLARELRTVVRNAAAMDDGRFSGCARVYYYAASAPAFALLLANHAISHPFNGRPPVTPGFGARLKEMLPARTYLLDDWWRPGRFELRDASGPVSAAALREGPCLVLRGHPARAQPLPEWLARNLPGIPLSGTCSTVDERIETYRVDCAGRPAP